MNLLDTYNPEAAQFDDVYVVEKIGTKEGWSHPAPDEEWQQGFYAEIQDFVECCASGRRPQSGALVAHDTVADALRRLRLGGADGAGGAGAGRAARHDGVAISRQPAARRRGGASGRGVSCPPGPPRVNERSAPCEASTSTPTSPRSASGAPPRTVANWHAARREKDASGGEVAVVGKSRQCLPPKSRWTPEERIADMDSLGVDMQIVSPYVGFYNYNLDTAVAVATSRDINDELERDDAHVAQALRGGPRHRCPCRT